ADRQLVPGQRDVDHLLAQAAIELLVGERARALGERRLETLADPVQEHPALAVAHLAQRQRELALAPEVAHAHLLERVARRRALDRGRSFALVLVPVHEGPSRSDGGVSGWSQAPRSRAGAAETGKRPL